MITIHEEEQDHDDDDHDDTNYFENDDRDDFGDDDDDTWAEQTYEDRRQAWCNAGRLADKKEQEKNVNDVNEDDWKSSKDVCYFDALFVFLKKKNYR